MMTGRVADLKRPLEPFHFWGYISQNTPGTTLGAISDFNVNIGMVIFRAAFLNMSPWKSLLEVVD